MLASIVIGLALVDILVSLNRLIRAGAVVRWHWAAPAATLLVPLTVMQIWWGLYAPRDTPPTIGEFLLVLVELVLLFLLAAAALPDDVPTEGLSLKDYYLRNSRYSGPVRRRTGLAARGGRRRNAGGRRVRGGRSG